MMCVLISCAGVPCLQHQTCTCNTVPPHDLEIRGSSNISRELDTVTIECNVTASPPANITWLKRTSEDSRKLLNTSRTSITHQVTYISRGPVTSSTLVISNLEVTDSGDYVCEARNSHSSPPVSTNFPITVISKSTHICREVTI